jgi:dipeptidyl aminopeptidase/acylaminoacyl peptidase
MAMADRRFEVLRPGGARLVVVCVLAVVAAVGWGAGPAVAAFPGTNGKIAFQGYDGAGAIFVIDPEPGAAAEQLVDANLGDPPAWSPDGSKIAFGHNDGKIYVVDAQPGAQPVPLVEHPAGHPAWSPDGTRIAFERSGDIYVVSALGGPVTQLVASAPGGYNQDPAWSPDGTQIAFVSNREAYDETIPEDDAGIHLYVTSAQGGGPDIQLTHGPVTVSAPSWSPDGTKIAVVGGGIHVVDVGTGTMTRLTVCSDIDPAWSPDGTKIAFSRSCDGEPRSIYVMNADGSAPTWLATGSLPDWGPSGDRDGDGLLDAWETSGIDVDGDGTVDLDLPAMGADPSHKDIFLEIDHMVGHELSDAAVALVVDAFAAAPVTNPDGASGVTLHVDNGPTSIMDPSGQTWDALSEADSLAHQAVLGSLTPTGDYDWSAVDDLKAVSFSDAREPAFHYLVSGHRYGSATKNSSGLSRGIGASDLLVTLGPASEPGEGAGTVDQQAGTIMHELGHNLGLRHGGDDDTNYKPSYLSVMNYSFQFTGLALADGTFRLDYSRLPVALDENALEEATGFGFAAGTEPAQFVTLRLCPGSPTPDKGGTLHRTPLLAGWVDWNCSGIVTVGPFSDDVNGDGVLSSFAPFLDWPMLVYDGGAIGDLAGSVSLPQTTEMIEPQLEELLANERVLRAGLDTAAPTVVGVPDRAPNPAGWYSGPVTIDWQATDDSGSASDPPDTIASTAGEGVVYTSDESCDPSGNCAAGTLVLSIDLTAPAVSVPGDFEMDATGPAGAEVSYQASASDDLDPSPSLVCEPASGGVFPIGATDVTCTATDAAGNSASATFTVTVLPEPGGELLCQGLVPTIVGSDAAELIVGTLGDDVILALGGDDRIWPGAGNDVVCAGAGDDRVHGGLGADRFDGGEGDDVLVGGIGADVLSGGGGDDVLEGMAGKDTIEGGEGDDSAFGGVGDDSLDGGSGTDGLDGGLGRDSCADGETVVRCEQ